MTSYEAKIQHELTLWQLKMTKKPTLIGRLTKGVQDKYNGLIPEKVHNFITASIQNMVQVVLAGSKFTTADPLNGVNLEVREKKVQERLNFYRKTAAVEGAGTGAGGILLGLADFPLLLTIKMKFLFELAAIYGYDVTDVRERLFILNLFQLAFSSETKRRDTYEKVLRWDETVATLDADSMDWRLFQQEYRDYIDLVKMFQLVPVIGAAVGAYANYNLLGTLGETAKMGYRLRYFKEA